MFSLLRNDEDKDESRESKLRQKFSESFIDLALLEGCLLKNNEPIKPIRVAPFVYTFRVLLQADYP